MVGEAVRCGVEVSSFALTVSRCVLNLWIESLDTRSDSEMKSVCGCCSEVALIARPVRQLVLRQSSESDKVNMFVTFGNLIVMK